VSADTSARIVVFGLGHVGCVTAAGLASIGHIVTGVDTDSHKVEKLDRGEAPFYEPGLEELIRRVRREGRLSATVSAAEGLLGAEVALLCLGTPAAPSGDLNLDQVLRVCTEIAEAVRGRPQPLVVAIRSTVFPGSCEEISRTCFEDTPLVSVVCNPEFLREGAAVNDFLQPSMLIVGASGAEAARPVAALYEPLGRPVSIVSLRAAELTKYASNAFHALKVTFANEMGTLASHVGVNGAEVMDALCRDTRLNISPAYLEPGFAFGGSCLPKDLRALERGAARRGLDLPLLNAIQVSNERHLDRSIRTTLSVRARRLGIVGLTFKADTDDLRGSPVVTLVERLLAEGREVRIFDPHIRLDQIYGTNRQFVLCHIPHIEKLMIDELGELCRWADHLVVTQKLAERHRELLQASAPPVIDLTVLAALAERLDVVYE
jgi:GDP-mannose 6-dehydrogenase